MAQPTKKKGVSDRAKDLGRLWWLVDAPQFIDTRLVSGLHDAIVRPDFADERVESKNISNIRTYLEGGGELKIEAEIAAPAILKPFLPKLGGEGAIDARAQHERKKEEIEGRSGLIIRTPERILNEIVVEYLSNYPRRILFVEMPGGTYSNVDGPLTDKAIQDMLDSPPRPLVFANIAAKSVIFPTVAEMESGGFKRIFETLEQALTADGETAPSYPSDQAPNVEELRKKYWDSLKKRFKSRIAMETLEKECAEGRIGWIDFRLLFNDQGDSAHLHVVPAGAYHAGVFGYNFVHRGYRHGCRIVGSLKCGNDINVLAIYER